MKVTKKQALKAAQTVQDITISDGTIGWVNVPITIEEFAGEMTGRSHWCANQREGKIYIDMLSGVTFTLTL